MTWRRAAATGAAAALAVAVPVAAAGGSRGSPGGGDPFFPGAGNGGYDVAHYGVRLRVDPGGAGGGSLLGAKVAVRAIADRRLEAFNLDLAGLTVDRVAIDGRRAGFRRRGSELTVLPDAPLPAGKRFTTAIRYHGAPRPHIDPDGTSDGWDSTPDGAVVLAEPVGAPTWIPCDDHPTDKASFDFAISLPSGGTLGRVGIANGRLVGVRDRGRRRVWRWRERQPMAPYLATVSIGNFRLLRSRIGRIPVWTGIHRSWLAGGAAERSDALRAKRLLPRILRFEERLFGPYPFDAAGIVIGASTDFDYALETQTRPTFPAPPSTLLEVHELAHQWFGDSVSVRSWPNIWLNEGFATYAEWIWRERHGGPTARHIFGLLRQRPPGDLLWDPPPGHPGSPRKLFAPSIYLRGAMALEALRLRVGDRVFFKTLRDWARELRYGNASIGRFVRFAERESGAQLDALFERWLYQRGKPGPAVS